MPVPEVRGSTRGRTYDGDVTSGHPLQRTVIKAGLGVGALSAGAAGLLLSQVRMARRAIGISDERPPSPDGEYGDDQPGKPIRLLVLGDSAAVGYGLTDAESTPPALMGIGLSHLLESPVIVRSEARVGATSADLHEQVNRGLTHKPDVAVIIIGTNDVTHRVRAETSARRLGQQVRRLEDTGCEVIVGTIPDLGTIGPIPQPLRWLARRNGRRLALRQMIVTVENGGRAVSLGDLLGPVFSEKFDVMFGADKFHPSATGYANMVAVLVPSIAAAVRAPEEPPETGAVMQLAEAADRAQRVVGTEVRRSGRRAAVQTRRAIRPIRNRRSRIPEKQGS
jgi:lysophospholipase L1-like esterase